MTEKEVSAYKITAKKGKKKIQEHDVTESKQRQCFLKVIVVNIAKYKVIMEFVEFIGPQQQFKWNRRNKSWLMSTWGGLKGWEIKKIKLKEAYTVNYFGEHA